MNLPCLGQLLYGDSSSLLLTQEQNNLKKESLPHKYFMPTKNPPEKCRPEILMLICNKSWTLFQVTLILLASDTNRRSVPQTREELNGTGNDRGLLAGVVGESHLGSWQRV